MLFSAVTLSLLALSVVATPSPVLQARAATTTVFMRIEGPTKTILEKTIFPAPETSLTVSGHTAKCDGTPKTAAGITSLVALQQTGQFFEAEWNGTTFGAPTKINGTSNKADQSLTWGSLFNNIGNAGTGGIVLQGGSGNVFDDFCFETLPNLQHFLFAYFGDIDETQFLIMSGPKTATVGSVVQYSVPFAPDGTYVNDLSVDTTTGESVHGVFEGDNGEDATVSITFTKAGTYNMKAHCPAGAACVRSNHVVTVVS